MIRSGNVLTVTFGGQPSKNPIVVIGGTQGANDQDFSVLADNALAALSIAEAQEITLTSDQSSALKALDVISPIALAGASLNFLDNLEPDSNIPLQFRNMNSDCRVFYTADDINNPTTTWSKISAGNFTCVDGGSKPGTSPKKSGGVKDAQLQLSLATALVLLCTFWVL
jgi:hypothetical protein